MESHNTHFEKYVGSQFNSRGSTAYIVDYYDLLPLKKLQLRLLQKLVSHIPNIAAQRTPTRQFTIKLENNLICKINIVKAKIEQTRNWKKCLVIQIVPMSVDTTDPIFITASQYALPEGHVVDA